MTRTGDEAEKARLPAMRRLSAPSLRVAGEKARLPAAGRARNAVVPSFCYRLLENAFNPLTFHFVVYIGCPCPAFSYIRFPLARSEFWTCEPVRLMRVEKITYLRTGGCVQRY